MDSIKIFFLSIQESASKAARFICYSGFFSHSHSLYCPCGFSRKPSHISFVSLRKTLPSLSLGLHIEFNFLFLPYFYMFAYYSK